MKERVDANSQAEGFTTSRLPKFTSEEVNFIKGKIRFTIIIAYLIKLSILSGESVHTNTKTILNFITYIISGKDTYLCSCNLQWGQCPLTGWQMDEYGDPDRMITEKK